MADREQLLTGNLWKLMIALSVPGIMGMLVVSVNSLVDAIFVSHLVNADAFAGVSLTLPLMTVNAAVIGMVSSGAGVLYSRAIGSEDVEVKEHLYGNMVSVILVAYLLTFTLGFIFAKPLLNLIGAEGKQLYYAEIFYRLAIAGGIFSTFGLCTSSLIRAEGKVKYAMKITAVCMVLNVAINPLLIKYAKLGVGGSALASIIAMAIYSMWTFLHFYSGKGYLNIHGKFKFKKGMTLLILKTGLPSLFMQLNGFFRQLVLFRLASTNSTSPEQLTAFTGIYRLFAFAAIPAFGVLQAFGPVVGVNFGAGNKKRVAESVSVFRTGAIALMALMALPGLLFPHFVLGLLLPSPTITIQLIFNFRLVLWILLIMPLASTSIVYMQTTGHSTTASRLTFSRELLLFLPIMILSVRWLNYEGIYYGLVIENVIYITIVFFIARIIRQRDCV